MNERDLYILRIVKFLYENNKTMSFTELGEHLNRNFNKTYSEDKGRGMAKVMSTLYQNRLPCLNDEQEKSIGAGVEYLQKCILQIKKEDGSSAC